MHVSFAGYVPRENACIYVKNNKYRYIILTTETRRRDVKNNTPQIIHYLL